MSLLRCAQTIWQEHVSAEGTDVCVHSAVHIYTINILRCVGDICEPVNLYIYI